MNNQKVFSLYIHIPFCLSKCTYCDFFSIKCSNQKGIPSAYVSSLINEIKYRIKEYGSNKCKSVYIGGGTPSLLSKSQFEEIFNFLKENLDFINNFEFTVELNPDDITKELLDFLNDSPVTRLSVGIQSLDNKVLEYVKRRAGTKENLNAIELIKKHWKKEISYDLISALPFEQDKAFLKNLKFICKQKPHHISMYSLTVEDETPLGKEINSESLFYDFERADSMWLKGKKLLEKKGYKQYEISNFCLKNQECLHNLTYWNHEDYIGSGSGGTGTVYNPDGSGKRWTNTQDIERYILTWKEDKPDTCDFETVEIIDKDTSMFEFFMMGLRKTKGVTNNQFKNIFNMDIPFKVQQLFKNWQKKKLSVIKKEKDDTRYYLNSKGLLFLNQFLEQMEL